MPAPKQHIDHFVAALRARRPDATIDVDAPSRPSDRWFVDVRARGQSWVVEFRPKVGFGISSAADDSYGEGPDEFISDAAAAATRVAQLIHSREPTTPQRVHLLQELREHRQISQIALAEKLGVRQPTVSKIERRYDVALSTLRRYVEALGGELRVTAQFADKRIDIELDDDSEPG